MSEKHKSIKDIVNTAWGRTFLFASSAAMLMANRPLQEGYPPPVEPTIDPGALLTDVAIGGTVIVGVGLLLAGLKSSGRRSGGSRGIYLPEGENNNGLWSGEIYHKGKVEITVSGSQVNFKGGNLSEMQRASLNENDYPSAIIRGGVTYKRDGGKLYDTKDVVYAKLGELGMDNRLVSVQTAGDKTYGITQEDGGEFSDQVLSMLGGGVVTYDNGMKVYADQKITFEDGYEYAENKNGVYLDKAQGITGGINGNIDLAVQQLAEQNVIYFDNGSTYFRRSANGVKVRRGKIVRSGTGFAKYIVG